MHTTYDMGLYVFEKDWGYTGCPDEVPESLHYIADVKDLKTHEDGSFNLELFTGIDSTKLVDKTCVVIWSTPPLHGYASGKLVFDASILLGVVHMYNLRFRPVGLTDDQRAECTDLIQHVIRRQKETEGSGARMEGITPGKMLTANPSLEHAPRVYAYFEDLVMTDMPRIDHVIFHDPATIVYWDDGTKTVVKANRSGKKKDRDKFREDYGLAMAIAKKYLGGRAAFEKAVANAERREKKED